MKGESGDTLTIGDDAKPKISTANWLVDCPSSVSKSDETSESLNSSDSSEICEKAATLFNSKDFIILKERACQIKEIQSNFPNFSLSIKAFNVRILKNVQQFIYLHYYWYILT